MTITHIVKSAAKSNNRKEKNEMNITLDPYSYKTLGMFEEEFEDRIDMLRKESMSRPVQRRVVDNLLAEYGVEFSTLSTWLKNKVGDILICD